MNLGEALHAVGLRFPQKTALACREETITYEALDRAARGLSHWLLRQGLQPGDRVAVHSANSIDAVKLLLACFHAGMIAVPVNIRLKAAEVQFILGHCSPRLCFSQPQLAPVVEAACAAGGFPLALHTKLPSEDSDAALPSPHEEDPVLILYTSGTTARPKGVVHNHASLLATANTICPCGITPETTMLVAVPLMHGTGLMATTLPALLCGATTVLTPGFDAAEVLDTIERRRCTWGLGLPAMMQLMAAEQERQPRDVTSLVAWVAGGDSVPVSLQGRFQHIFGFPLQEGYAMTESIVIAWNRLDAMRAGSLGRPADGVKVRVVDYSGVPVADGQPGELAVRSPANFAGYWQDEEATRAARLDGWLLTGDLGWRDSGGYLWFAGRRKEVIIRGGSNIAPQEVEEALYQHPAVMEVGVIGMPDPIYNEQVVACVSLREGLTAGERELIEFARVRLADYKLPARIFFLPVLPKGITGKVQRRALKELAAAASA